MWNHIKSVTLHITSRINQNYLISKPKDDMDNTPETEPSSLAVHVTDAGMVNPKAVQLFRAQALDGKNFIAAEKVYSLFVLHLWHSSFYNVN